MTLEETLKPCKTSPSLFWCLAPMISLFVNTLYIWAAAFLAPLVLNLHDLLGVSLVYFLYRVASFTFNDNSITKKKKRSPSLSTISPTLPTLY